jgi:hypothetical protein
MNFYSKLCVFFRTYGFAIFKKITLIAGTFEGDTSSSNLASPLSPIVEASDNDIRADENNSEPETETQDSVQQSSPGYIKSPSGVTIELLGQDLWKKFYKLGTEMIITKAGRYEFYQI